MAWRSMPSRPSLWKSKKGENKKSSSQTRKSLPFIVSIPPSTTPDFIKDLPGFALLPSINASVIGASKTMESPYGTTQITYADHTASGKPLHCVEELLQNEMMPLYANTHTEASLTGLVTSALREQARERILRSVNADASTILIFSNSGVTGAINHLIGMLNLKLPYNLNKKYSLDRHIPDEDRPVVFIGPYEHHSNELTWRESLADTITIPETKEGQVDLAELEQQLIKYSSRPLLIGSFSAGSNVTGILTDTSQTAALLHKHNALAFFDYAAAGPYVKVDMQDDSTIPGSYKDATFFSPHKFVGGPGTPGILICRKEVLNRALGIDASCLASCTHEAEIWGPPDTVGGGTVAFVNQEKAVYLDDPVARNEGGTPAIIESIRAGLVFALKDEVGTDVIEAVETDYVQRAIEVWSNEPGIKILGNIHVPRLSIISFVINHEKGMLHHNFVVTLLNDLFGIQSRGGCSCAGPYGHGLLGIDLEKSQKIEDGIQIGGEGMKPGWTRVNFHYAISEEEFQFIVKAVVFIARHGELFLNDYTFHIRSGLWKHRLSADQPTAVPDLFTRSNLFSNALSQSSVTSSNKRKNKVSSKSRTKNFNECLRRAIVLASKYSIKNAKAADESQDRPEPSLRNPQTEALRWFVLPDVVVDGTSF